MQGGGWLVSGCHIAVIPHNMKANANGNFLSLRRALSDYGRVIAEKKISQVGEGAVDVLSMSIWCHFRSKDEIYEKSGRRFSQV